MPLNQIKLKCFYFSILFHSFIITNRIVYSSPALMSETKISMTHWPWEHLISAHQLTSSWRHLKLNYPHRSSHPFTIHPYFSSQCPYLSSELTSKKRLFATRNIQCTVCCTQSNAAPLLLWSEISEICRGQRRLAVKVLDLCINYSELGRKHAQWKRLKYLKLILSKQEARRIVWSNRASHINVGV